MNATSIMQTTGKYRVRRYVGQQGMIHWRIEWRGAWGLEESVRIYKFTDVVTTLRTYRQRDAFRTEKG
jgi:hypothetical protein